MQREWDEDDLKVFINRVVKPTTTKLEKLWENESLDAFAKTELYFSSLINYKNLYFIYYNNDFDYIKTVRISFNKIFTARKIMVYLDSFTDSGMNVRNVEIYPFTKNIIIDNCTFYDYINNTQETDNNLNIPLVIFGEV